jgi:hypothetical protein
VARFSKLKFLLAILLGLGFSGIVNAQDKKIDTSSNKLNGPREQPKEYIIDGTLIKSESALPYNVFLNQEYSSFNDMELNNPKAPIHTGFRPLIGSTHNQDSVQKIKTHSLLYRKVYQENLFIIRDSADKFYATIDPLFNFQGAMDHSDSNKKFVQNTRGILIQGNVGSKFAFSSIFWENLAAFPTYINQYINENYVVPGNARPKAFGVKDYDFSMSEAYMTFTPSSHFSFQAGYGKNFIGDGYRSLLLSDNSFAYPYIRVTTTFWHLQYTNLYTEFQDPFADPAITLVNVEGLIQRKAGAFQYLSWNVCPRVEWGFFQGLIWTAGDQFNHMSFNANYFDPIIGGSALTYGLGNTNNVLLGSTIKYKICKHVMAYGQLLVDDFPQNGNMNSFYNRTGLQGGLKYYNKFGEFQLEYNQVRPYTYSSKDSLENYSQNDQALADPLGANFKELIGIINLRYHHFSIHLQGDYALEGLDSNGRDQGSNIFLPDTRTTDTKNVVMLQGIRSTLMYMDVHISYLMNPRTNMNISLGVARRTLTNSLDNQQPSTLIYLGFRTSIENMYVDF